MGLGVVVVCGVIAVVWIVTQHALDLVPSGPQIHAGAPVSKILLAAVGQTGSWLYQRIGEFGSLDTTSPLATHLCWWVACGAVVLLALAVGLKRELTVLAGMILVTFVLPAIIEFPKATSQGLVWQGRYTLPLAVGIPLVGAAMVGKSELPSPVIRRVAGLLLVVLPIAGLLAFAEAVRRYSTGVSGPLVPLRGGWQPPGGSLLAMAWYTMALASFALLAWRITRARSRDLNLSSQGE